MKINFPDFKHIKFSYHYGMRLRPVRDWFILLGLFATLLAASALWNLWFYQGVRAGADVTPPAGAVAPVFSQASLEALKAIFADRATEEDKYTSGAYSFIDPSR